MLPTNSPQLFEGALKVTHNGAFGVVMIRRCNLAMLDKGLAPDTISQLGDHFTNSYQCS